ncbi:hypothetical protein EV363DRAFT_1303696 [Boletus edulis]|nr:hypothetical protein EV363DRAFT_1303696 [Boletus edulis]
MADSRGRWWADGLALQVLENMDGYLKGPVAVQNLLPKAVSLSTLLDHYLCDYFTPNGLDIISIPFNLGTADKIDNWPVYISLVLDGLCSTYHHVIFIITNHTDEDSDDLFLDKNKCNKEFLASVDEFLEVLLEPFCHHLPSSVAYFLACSSIVGNKDSFFLLCQTVRRNVVVHHIEFVTTLEHLLQDETKLGKCSPGFEWEEEIEGEIPVFGEVP